MRCTEVVSYNKGVQFWICQAYIIHVKVGRDVVHTSKISMLTSLRLRTGSGIQKIYHACCVKENVEFSFRSIPYIVYQSMKHMKMLTSDTDVRRNPWWKQMTFPIIVAEKADREISNRNYEATCCQSILREKKMTYGKMEKLLQTRGKGGKT